MSREFLFQLAAFGVGIGTLIYIVGRLSGHVEQIDKRLERIENVINCKKGE